MLYSERHLTPMAAIQRLRMLPAPGTILRRVDDHVASTTIVAEAQVPTGYCLLDLEKELDTRVRDVRQVLTRKRDEAFGAGEVIARAGMLVKKEYVSPVAGKVIDVHGSKVLIEVAPQHVDLAAFYPGKIVNILPNVGVLIEVIGALVQGAWGTGQELRARLERAVPDGNTPLEGDMVTASHMGAILLGGRTLDAGAISKAAENKVSGVIVGSIRSSLLPAIEAASLSLIVTEGFGDMAMNSNTFELLRAYAGREVCFSPNARNMFGEMRWESRWPEILIPLPGEGQPPPAEHAKHGPGVSLQVGTRVRALRAPYQGIIGQVVSLPPHRRAIASGARVYGAEIDLPLIGSVFVPLANLEIVR